MITTKLGGKDKALKLVQSDNEDIQRQALQSVSKIKDRLGCECCIEKERIGRQKKVTA